MTPHTNELLNVTGQAAPVDGAWFAIPQDSRPQLPVIVSVKAGTGTVVVEGRNSPHDTPVVISTGGASAGVLANKYPQMRARITAVTAALTVVVSIAASAIPTQ